MDKKKLTDKQKMFCEEYMIDLNATQSSIRAGYSKNTAQEIGSENLSKPLIQEYLAELKAKRSEKLEIDSNNVLKELLNWAYGDTTDFMLQTVEEIKSMPPEIRRLVTGFKAIERITKDSEGNDIVENLMELKFISKEKAMEMITKHIGFNELDNRQQSEQPQQITIIHNDKQIDLSTD